LDVTGRPSSSSSCSQSPATWGLIQAVLMGRARGSLRRHLPQLRAKGLAVGRCGPPPLQPPLVLTLSAHGAGLRVRTAQTHTICVADKAPRRGHRTRGDENARDGGGTANFERIPQRPSPSSRRLPRSTGRRSMGRWTATRVRLRRPASCCVIYPGRSG
jgi:hypothetical protein